MEYESKEIKLKNGQTVCFRAPTAEDAENVLTYMKTVTAETDFLMNYPEEYVLTAEDEAKILDGMKASEKRLMILCETDGKLLGNCMLSFGERIKTSHRATVAISVLKEYWGLGIGTALFREMIRISEENGILQMELEFVEGNEGAKALYEKLGFTIVAEKPNALRLKDGTMLKEYFMVKYL